MIDLAMPRERKSAARRRSNGRWRHSLYARAALFLLLGAGSLLGAVVVWSSTIVDESVDRLLDERIDLAQTVGRFVEHHVRSDLDRLADAVRPVLATGSPAAAEVRGALAAEYRGTLFAEGAFVLDPDGNELAAVPDSPRSTFGSADLAELRALAEARGGMASSPLVHAGPVPVLVVLEPVRGRDRPLGFVGGLLQPSATNLLGPMATTDSDDQLRFELVDAQGIVVASTAERSLYRLADHGNVLASALRDDRDLEGRCHTCHTEPEGPGVLTTTDVLAFAPLPTLRLGLAVHQPEAKALAPAFALRSRLMLVGLAFVALFLTFAGLSVRSVVRPVKRLTRAVHGAEVGPRHLALGPYGRDEVGELADAFEFYHSRMLESLADAERSREALRAETEATRRHLETLQEIVAESTLGHELPRLVDSALHHLLALHELSAGVLCVRYRGRRAEATWNLEAGATESLLQRAEALLEAPSDSPQRGGRPGAAAVVGRFSGSEPVAELEDTEAEVGANVTGPHRITFLDAAAAGASEGGFVVAALETTQGLRVVAALGGTEGGPPAVRRDRLVSLLHHVGMSATNLLVRELDQERRRLQRSFLQRVLRAQEGERRRIARELHDTLAQDLAALRLEIERLGTRAEGDRVARRLRDLEGRAGQMLAMVRQILLDLRLSALESMGFLPALQAHCDRVGRDSGVRVTLAIDGDEQPLDYDTAVTLFRIVQESLLNAAQHAEAQHVIVTVAFQPERVELTIEDDGRGFDLEAVRQRGVQEQRGLGLVGMEERARLLGGELTITTSPDEGTTVRVNVPLPSAVRVATAELPVESS